MVQDPLLEGWLGHPGECKIQDPLLGGGLGRSGEAKVQDPPLKVEERCGVEGPARDLVQLSLRFKFAKVVPYMALAPHSPQP